MDFLTREVFDGLIIAVIIIGIVWASARLYQDFTRPIRRRGVPEWAEEDTQPHPVDMDDSMEDSGDAPHHQN